MSEAVFRRRRFEGWMGDMIGEVREGLFGFERCICEEERQKM